MLTSKRDGKQRLFIGIYPGGIVYADRDIAAAGDYKRVAFLPYRSLVLNISDETSPLIAEVLADVAQMEAQRDRH